MPERLFGWLHAADRQHSFKCENKAISSKLCRDGMHEFIDGGGERGNSYVFFSCLTCLTFFSELVNTKCFVRTAWRKMQTFCACHGAGFYPETLHILHIDMHKKNKRLLIWISRQHLPTFTNWL